VERIAGAKRIDGGDLEHRHAAQHAVVEIDNVARPVTDGEKGVGLLGDASETFAEIGTRPLFSPGRRGTAAPAATGATTLQPPDVTLVGIMIDSQDRIAMLRTPSSPLATAFHIGATVSGWQLSEIAPDRIVLSAGPARDEIRLDANKAPVKPPMPPSGNSQ